MTDNFEAPLNEYIVASTTFPPDSDSNDIIIVKLVTIGQKNIINPLEEMELNNPVQINIHPFPIVEIQRWWRKSKDISVDELRSGSSKMLWSQPFATDNVADIRVTDVVIGKENGHEIVLFSGVTTGYGTALGGGYISPQRNDIDGFITKLNAKDGLLFSPDPPTLSISSQRIHTLPGYADEVTGMCVDNTKGVVYVVGSTTLFGIRDPLTGNLFYTAFIMMLDIRTLETLWSRQIKEINSNHSTFGRGCSVQKERTQSFSGGAVNFVGIVKNGGQVSETLPSFGEDDLFISYHSDSGDEIYLTQWGTKFNDFFNQTIEFIIGDSHNGCVSISGRYCNSTNSTNSTTVGVSNCSTNDLKMNSLIAISPEGIIDQIFPELHKRSNPSANEPLRLEDWIEFGIIFLGILCLLLILVLIRRKNRISEKMHEKKGLIQLNVLRKGGAKPFSDMDIMVYPSIHKIPGIC